MKVRLTHVHQGLGKGPGAIVDMPEDWCRRAIAGGMAEPPDGADGRRSTLAFVCSLSQ